jgi:hypothetical protein
MIRKLIAVAVLLLVPSAVKAQGIGEALQGLLDPHIVAGVSYGQDSHKYAAVLTANVVGPKLGSIPCYAAGAGVSLNTLAPGLEDTPIAAASFPVLTCAPFGEKIVLQAGVSVPLSSQGLGERSYYFGAGLSVSGGPNALKAKRVKRIAAKKAKQAALAGPPSPAAY